MKIIRPQAITSANLVSSTVTDTEAAWAVGTTYAADAIVKRAKGGIERRFSSVGPGNVGHDPALDSGANWVDLGPTNKWAMFEASIAGQTTAADEIEVVFDTTGWVTQIALLNVAGVSARVRLHTAAEGTYYDETFSLVSTSGITDMLLYLTEPIVRKRNLLVPNLPFVASPRVTVTISAPGETVACGICLPGLARKLGGTEWGGKISLRDFSTKEDDPYGGEQVQERAFRRVGAFTSVIDNRDIDAFADELADVRATPTLFIANDAITASAIWGFINDWSIGLDRGNKRSTLTLQLESLA